MLPNTACSGLAGTVRLFGQVPTRQPLTQTVGQPISHFAIPEMRVEKAWKNSRRKSLTRAYGLG